MSPAKWAYLFGNGLSLMFNRDYYELRGLTAQVRVALNSIPGLRGEGKSLLSELEDIAASLETDRDRARIRTFEELAGPLDRLSNVLLQVGPLARLAHREAQLVIDELWAQLRGLYKRVVGIVLGLVVNHGEGKGEWAYLQAVAQRLGNRCLQQDELDVFTLNYDALLDAALVREETERRSTDSAFALMDEFDGRTRFEIPVFTPDESIERVWALSWRTDPYRPPLPVMRLHHLHGAGMWLRYRGVVCKAASLQALRDCRIYESWAAGVEGQEEEGSVDPVVLLGDQKETSVSRRPFDETYEALVRALTEADYIVVAGYSFQDLPLNRILRDYRGGAQVHIVTTSPPISRIREAFGIGSSQLPGWLTIDGRGLPEGVTDEPLPDEDG